MKLFLIYLPFLIFSHYSFAFVDMKNASYGEKWVDIIESGPGYNMKIERYYSSRSLFIGLFGFGWCSELETSLEPRTDGSVLLTECGGGLEITYYPEKFDKRSPSHTIDKIINYVRKSKRKLDRSYLKKLRSQLLTDTKQRFELAKQFHLVSMKELKNKPNSFISKSRGLEKISFNGSEYSRVNSKGSIEKFNKSGKLVRIIDRMGNSVKIGYKGPKLVSMTDNSGRRLTFSYGKDGLLKRIFDGKALDVEYSFSNNNLTRVRNAWKNTYTYEYDKNHNMTKVTFPDSSFIALTYDIANDWVKSYTDRRKCREEFEFLLSRDDPKNHYWSTSIKKCAEKITTQGRFEFWHRKYAHGGGKYLERAFEQTSQTYKDTFFHPYLGKPISRKEKKSKTTFGYFGSGLLKKKEIKVFDKAQAIDEWFTLSFQYNNKFRKISEAVRTILNKQGKPLSSTKTFFNYNKKGLLTKTSRSSGLFINIEYDSRGRISQLIDHKKSKIRISYDPATDRPIRLVQARVGEVKIAYDSNGNVETVKSPKGRSIASSVIQNFLDFIEMIGPAAEELRI